MATKTWIACALLLAVLVAALALNLKPSDRHSSTPGLVMTGARIDAPFVLVNHLGRPATDKDFAGKYRLMFFGFTFCPSVCPTEMQKIAEVLNGLGEQADQVAALFITIDPNRDPPDVLKSYLEPFDKRITGLVGPHSEIRKLADAYKVYYRKVGDGPDYTMDHSAFIYLVSPDGDLINLYRMDQTAEDILNDLKPRLKP
jgi:protein SCO1